VTQPCKDDIVTYNGLPCRVVFDTSEEDTSCWLAWQKPDGTEAHFTDVHISRIERTKNEKTAADLQTLQH
jgi:hypothetical protein